MPDFTNWHFPIEWFYAFIAGVGGAARYLNMYLNDGRFFWGNFMANIFISGFSGLMFALVGRSMNLPQEILFIFSGVGGFMGHNALEYIFSNYIKPKINL